ncbi:MAG: type II toxin-antitoxin system prevent-host-death family antitoxin [Nocardioides sp.]
MTATEASRNFARVLDRVERGETIVLTRGGRTIAAIGPATPRGNGRAVNALLAAGPPDPELASELDAVRSLLVPDAVEWRAD